MRLAFGAKVSRAFSVRVIEIAKLLDVHPDYLMACMAFETGRTFSPSVRNAAGSGATGLIQFMPTTAAALGTTTDKLARMSAVAQLDYVYAYFKPWRGKLRTLDDVYMAILWPAAIGKPGTHILFDKADTNYPKRYVQNAGLDRNRDGVVGKAEATDKVRALLVLGLSDGYVADVTEEQREVAAPYVITWMRNATPNDALAAQVMRLQTALASVDAYTGKIDGHAGDKTSDGFLAVTGRLLPGDPRLQR